MATDDPDRKRRSVVALLYDYFYIRLWNYLISTDRFRQLLQNLGGETPEFFEWMVGIINIGFGDRFVEIFVIFALDQQDNTPTRTDILTTAEEELLKQDIPFGRFYFIEAAIANLISDGTVIEINEDDDDTKLYLTRKDAYLRGILRGIQVLAIVALGYPTRIRGV